MKKILILTTLIAAGAAVSAATDLPPMALDSAVSVKWMPEAEITSKLQGMGYTVIGIEREDGRYYEAKMRDAHGFEVEAHLDAETGEPLRHAEDDRRSNRDDD